MSKRGRRNVSGLAALGGLGAAAAALMLGKRGKGVDLSETKKPAAQDASMPPKKPRTFEEAKTFPVGSSAAVADKNLTEEKYTPYKKGGSVSKRADGCAQRGKTRGKMI